MRSIAFTTSSNTVRCETKGASGPGRPPWHSRDHRRDLDGAAGAPGSPTGRPLLSGVQSARYELRASAHLSLRTSVRSLTYPVGADLADLAPPLSLRRASEYYATHMRARSSAPPLAARGAGCIALPRSRFFCSLARKRSRHQVFEPFLDDLQVHEVEGL